MWGSTRVACWPVRWMMVRTPYLEITRLQMGIGEEVAMPPSSLHNQSLPFFRLLPQQGYLAWEPVISTSTAESSSLSCSSPSTSCIGWSTSASLERSLMMWSTFSKSNQGSVFMFFKFSNRKYCERKQWSDMHIIQNLIIYVWKK